MKLESLFRRLARVSFVLLWIPLVILGIIVISMVVWLGPPDFERVTSEMSMPMAMAVFGVWIVLTLILGVAIPFFSFAATLAGSREAKRILKTGMEADAVIVSSQDSGTRINHNPVLNFSLRVTPPAGETFFAETSHTVSIAHIPAFQPGCNLAVKYEPGTKNVAILGPRL